MKKLIAIVLTLVLALSFAACAQPEAAPAETAAPETTESAAPAELVKVKVGASVTPHAEILNAVKDELKAAGFDYIELPIGQAACQSEVEFQETCAYLRDVALPVYACNNFFTPDIKLVGDQVDKGRARAFYQKALERASRLGAR